MNTTDFPNAIVFESSLHLFGSIIGLCVVVCVLVWGGYRRGRANAPLWRAMLTKVPVGIAVFDTGEQAVVFANQPADRLIKQLDTPLVDQALESAQHSDQRLWTIRGQDNFLVHVQTVVLEDFRNTMLVLLQDMTEQQAQKATHRAFIQALGHELQTPLTAIQGHLTHIAKRSNGEMSDELAGSLQVVRDEIERLTWLTPNVLTILKLDAEQALNQRPHNLGVIAEEAVQELWEKAVARKISLYVEVDSALARVLVDRSAWKQVFINLIDNGIKYGKDGGSVTVSIQQTDDTQVIMVTDDGPGIAPHDIPHIFETLYRGERQQHTQGSGLGLSIVQQIVERHNGHIECLNNGAEKQGTTFRIVLPLNG
ncbi:MAG: HAMP domain-containing sensor histidine kinase [Chloroflexota bacterium]